jgi:ABC-type transporter MlaC component
MRSLVLKLTLLVLFAVFVANAVPSQATSLVDTQADGASGLDPWGVQ